MPAAESLDLALFALAHPARRRIVEALVRGPSRVTDLAAPFAMSLNAVSKHLKVLEQAGLLSRTLSGREHVLRLRTEPLQRVNAWTGRFERFWHERLDALEEQLEQAGEEK